MRIMMATIAAGIVLLAGDMRNGSEAADSGRVPPSPVGHRQPTARDVPSAQDNTAEDAMKKMDQNLDRKVRSICRGC